VNDFNNLLCLTMPKTKSETKRLVRDCLTSAKGPEPLGPGPHVVARLASRQAEACSGAARYQGADVSPRPARLFVSGG
jgi:hypothetical protein